MSEKKDRQSMHSSPVDILDSTVDVDELIQKNPCADVYQHLEDCLYENSRNWSKCQEQVRVLFCYI